MSDVFVSYAREDRERIQPLIRALKEKGWTVWWDPTLLPGQRYEDVIEAELETAKCVIVVWSMHSVKSDWVKREARYGDEKGILAPVLLDDVKAPWIFREYHAANLTQWDNNELESLLEAVSAFARPPKNTSQSVVPPSAAGGVTTEAPRQEKPSERRRLPFHLQIPVVLTVLGTLVVSGFMWYVVQRGRNGVVDPSQAGVRRQVDDPAPAKSTAPAVNTRVNPKDGLNYIRIPEGTFVMGCSPGDQECDDYEKPPHQVTITKGFYISETEVTQEAYRRVTSKTPSQFKGDQLPVEQVTWDEAKSYCEAVDLRLPTEAEWEFAARAGTTAARDGAIDDVGWYSSNSGGKTHPVKSKAPNAWGLYDTLGNVWEWVEDRFDRDYYKVSLAVDPRGPVTGKLGVLRGGSWGNTSHYLRVSDRGGIEPTVRKEFNGFRCAGELR